MCLTELRCVSYMPASPPSISDVYSSGVCLLELDVSLTKRISPRCVSYIPASPPSINDVALIRVCPHHVYSSNSPYQDVYITQISFRCVSYWTHVCLTKRISLGCVSYWTRRVSYWTQTLLGSMSVRTTYIPQILASGMSVLLNSAHMCVLV